MTRLAVILGAVALATLTGVGGGVLLAQAAERRYHRLHRKPVVLNRPVLASLPSRPPVFVHYGGIL